MDPGPERIAAAFAKAQADERAALLICLPSDRRTAWTIEAAGACVDAGADMLEFQMRAPCQAELLMEKFAAVAAEVSVPCLLWTETAMVNVCALSPNPPWPLVAACRQAGIAAIAAPVAAGRAQEFAAACGDEVAGISFVSPRIEAGQFEELCRHSRGFTYAVGVETSPPTDPEVFEVLAGFMERVRSASGGPVVVGAGVTTPAQANLAATFADGVAAARAVFESLRHANEGGHYWRAALETTVRGLHAGTHRSGRVGAA